MDYPIDVPSQEIPGPFSYKEVQDTLQYVIDIYEKSRNHCEKVIQDALAKEVITDEEAKKLRAWVDTETKVKNQS